MPGAVLLSELDSPFSCESETSVDKRYVVEDGVPTDYDVGALQLIPDRDYELTVVNQVLALIGTLVAPKGVGLALESYEGTTEDTTP